MVSLTVVIPASSINPFKSSSCATNRSLSAYHGSRTFTRARNASHSCVVEALSR